MTPTPPLPPPPEKKRKKNEIHNFKTPKMYHQSASQPDQPRRQSCFVKSAYLLQKSGCVPGGELIFYSYIVSSPASTVHPNKAHLIGVSPASRCCWSIIECWDGNCDCSEDLDQNCYETLHFCDIWGGGGV